MSTLPPTKPHAPPLLGEWACLGALYAEPSHGFAIAARLRPDGDLGRVWSLSRPLTYRCLDQLIGRGFVHVLGEEQGRAGGNRTVLAATRSGRAQLRRWLAAPVPHLRDLRSELLLKLVLAELCRIDVGPMLQEQRTVVKKMVGALDDQAGSEVEPVDAVLVWRRESAHAALRVLDRLVRRRVR